MNRRAASEAASDACAECGRVEPDTIRHLASGVVPLRELDRGRSHTRNDDLVKERSRCPGDVYASKRTQREVSPIFVITSLVGGQPSRPPPMRALGPRSDRGRKGGRDFAAIEPGRERKRRGGTRPARFSSRSPRGRVLPVEAQGSAFTPAGALDKPGSPTSVVGGQGATTLLMRTQQRGRFVVGGHDPEGWSEPGFRFPVSWARANASLRQGWHPTASLVASESHRGHPRAEGPNAGPPLACRPRLTSRRSR
jgi:hypothetical protein